MENHIFNTFAEAKAFAQTHPGAKILRDGNAFCVKPSSVHAVPKKETDKARADRLRRMLDEAWAETKGVEAGMKELDKEIIKLKVQTATLQKELADKSADIQLLETLDAVKAFRREKQLAADRSAAAQVDRVTGHPNLYGDNWDPTAIK